MLKRLMGFFGLLKSPDFYVPATRNHLIVKQRGPERIMETTLYNAKDDAWYVQGHENFPADGYTSHEIAAWTYLPIRRLAKVTEKERN